MTLIGRLGAIVVIAIGILGTWAGTCVACSCAQMTPAEALASADVVFRGTVVSIEDPGPDVIIPWSDHSVAVTFAVDDVLKGDVDRHVTVTTAADSASCGASFVDGGRYEVMARTSADAGARTSADAGATSADAGLTTSLCAGNLRLPPLDGDATADDAPGVAAGGTTRGDEGAGGSLPEGASADGVPAEVVTAAAFVAMTGVLGAVTWRARRAHGEAVES